MNALSLILLLVGLANGGTLSQSGSGSTVNITGNAATVTTNANMTGPVTSVGNVTTIAGPVPVSKIDLSTCAAEGANADITSMSALHTVSNPVLFTSTPTLKGVTDASNVTAGYVGEFISSVTANATNFPTTTQYGDLVALVVPAGDWDVSAQMTWAAAGATVSEVIIGITTNSGNSGAGLSYGDNAWDAALTSMGSYGSAAVANYRISISAQTTCYFKIYGSYITAQATATGRISARRVR